MLMKLTPALRHDDPLPVEDNGVDTFRAVRQKYSFLHFYS